MSDTREVEAALAYLGATRRSARPSRLATHVVDSLVDGVVSGKLPAGSVVPSEPLLCAEFSVSRVVVREALTILQDKGLVAIRQGHGTTVCDRSSWDMMDPVILDALVRHDHSFEVLDNLVSVRVALECEMAAAAADRIAPSGIAKLNELLEAMAAARADREQFLALDVQFHDEIMVISGNQLGKAIVTSIHSHARRSTRYSGGELASQILESYKGHAAIAHALERGDSAAAGHEMRQHIMGSWHRRKPSLRGPRRAK